MGRVRVPPDAPTPPPWRVWRNIRDVALFDAGDVVRDVPYMWGCNMAVRRRVVETVVRMMSAWASRQRPV